jgi:hypothetical protein
MDTNQICNMIQDFLATFGESKRWVDALEPELERMGLEVDEPTEAERGDREFLFAIGDDAFFLDRGGEVVAEGRLD